MALVRRSKCALQELIQLKRSASVYNTGQCREFRTSNVLCNNNLEEIIMKIQSKGTQTQAAISSLIGVGSTKPYRLSGEDSEWSDNYTMKPLDRELKRKQLWIECNKAWQTKTEVDGTVLNAVKGLLKVDMLFPLRDLWRLCRGASEERLMLFRFYKRSLQKLDCVVWVKGTVIARAKDGYCVALAGHLAFLPKEHRKSRKLESIFRILTMYPRTGKIVVQEVNAKYFASLAEAQKQKKEEAEEEEGGEEEEIQQA